MRRFLLALVVALLALVWLEPTAVAVQPFPSVRVAVHTYDAPVYDAPENYTATERGPPFTTINYDTTTHDAVDLRSNRTPARPSGPTPRAIYGYDDTTLLAHTDTVAGTTSGPAEVIGGEISSRHRWQVAAANAPDAYAGVRQASQHLRDAGVPRHIRKEVLESFERGTICVQRAGADPYGLRYFGEGSEAAGRYLAPTFPAGRSSLALQPGNSMGSIAQFQIREGATYFSGRVGPNFGQPGGSIQYFVPNLADLGRL